MLKFPILEKLSISRFAMFPGNSDQGEGLHIEFQPGFTLIVGSNGLGKTTLITLLYRMLTGPFDIGSLSDGADLGSRRLEVTGLRPRHRVVLAQRVSDGALHARATLTLMIGNTRLRIERSLRDFSLRELEVSEVSREPSEEMFQRIISDLVGVWSYADWILLLRHIIFFADDRRPLLWDSSAQRQILRFLFLPAESAAEWTSMERGVLELDSRTRNLSATLHREERELNRFDTSSEGAADVRQELSALEELQQVDVERLPHLRDTLADVEQAREAARLRLMTAQQQLESTYRTLERAQLASIAARFPSSNETARYLYTQLMTNDYCTVCSSHAAGAAEHYRARIASRECIVCGTATGDEPPVPAGSLDDVASSLADLYDAHAREVEDATTSLESASDAYGRAAAAVATVTADSSSRAQRISFLVQQLPPEEADLHEQREELAGLRTRLTALQSELDTRRNAFRDFIEGVTRGIAEHASSIIEAFNSYASQFVVEACELVWSPEKSRIGEAGASASFPAFQLRMTGQDFALPVRRSNSEHVSESQREFLDLAFRMALIRAATYGGIGTLVIDAPESSLDAVFSDRAGTLLSSFAPPDLPSRLVVTSNLTRNGIIQPLLRSVPPDERAGRVVDLFNFAAPTAATRELANEYDAARAELLT